MALVISIGADPEVFLKNKKTGQIVSAHDLMPGTKEEPHKVQSGAIQVDGLAAEFNIDPALDANQFTTNIQTVMGELQKQVGNDYEFAIQPTAMFDEGYFKSLPEFNRTLGCVPDWNGWTGQLNDKPDGDVYQRAAGGHVHIGWGKNMDPMDPMHIEDCAKVARQLDYYLGMYSLHWDKDVERRKMYGKAGCFRPKEYGMEYRTLSNAWLLSPKLQKWVFNAAYKGFKDLINGDAVEDKLKDVCVDIINNSEEWWKTKKLGLTGMTELNQPPPLPKPHDPNKPVFPTDQLIIGLRKKFGFTDHMANIYIEAAEEGNTEAIMKCNAVIGHEYFTKE